jgi:hypothetical protein
MDILGKYIDELRQLFVLEGQTADRLKSLPDDLGRNKPPALLDEMDKALTERLKERQDGIRQKMMQVLQNPPHYARHFEKLDEFHMDCKSSYNTAVFIMTKFPNGNTLLDRQLIKVIETVKKSVEERGYTPRIAISKRYHPSLWDNVELHLVGCSRGIAIVEDKYKPELNPNVAMEWGCMKAMGKDVLFLAEKDFGNNRADWGGLIKDVFDWVKPSKAINSAISSWLPKLP